MASANETINSSSTYVFHPVGDVIKISLVFPTIVVGVYGLMANSLILYFMHKKTATNYQLRAFSRSSLIDRFIQSLALSDVLCSVTSLPVYVTEILTGFITTDVTCRVSRYVMFIFPVVTIMNYLFIGIERYLGVYHPLKVPSQGVCKRLIVVAWVLGAVFSGLAMPSYGLLRYDLNDNEHTLICKYDSSTKLDRIFFLSFMFFIYVLPSIILTTTCILILKFLRRFRRFRISPESSRASGDNTSNSTRLNNPSRSTNSRYFAQSVRSRSCHILAHPNNNTAGYKVTSMFVSLIFAFIIPYMLFIFYNGAVTILNFKMSFTEDYIVRMLAGVIIYANGAVGSSILFYNSSYLRTELESLFIKVFIPRIFTSNDSGGINLKNLSIGQQRTSKESKHFQTKL